MAEERPCLLLPTHVRPVLSRVRPSAHSQRKEPWVFVQRPLVHTPGKTSHSLMSAGHRHAASSDGFGFALAAVSDIDLPSQTSPFIRAKPREQLVSGDT